MSFGGGGGGDGIPTDRPFTGDPIARWKTDTGFYPSNVQQWWTYKRPVVLSADDPPRGFLEVFDTDMRHQFVHHNTAAPAGHYIINPFHTDRSALSGIAGLAVTTSGGRRPAVTAFYAGRAFYAGTQSPNHNTTIYFSQIIERDEQADRCHQQQDPSEEEVPDLLSSDGGVIRVPELAQVVKLYAKGDSLFIFATNGVWRISGSEGVGFRANDYSVTKITNTPALSATSFVDVDGNPMWWNRSGIWIIIPSDGGLTFTAQSITEPTIKSFFQAIPDDSKKYAKGAYNHATRIVQWIYRTTAPTTVSERYEYDNILNFNVATGGFYPWTQTNDDVDFRGIFAAEGDATVSEQEDVYVGTDLVYGDGGTSVVEHTATSRVAVDSTFKYLVNVAERTS